MSLRMLWIFVLPAAYCLDVYLETKQVTAEIGGRLVLKCGVLEPCEELRFRWGPKGDRPFPNYSEQNLSPTESQLTIDPVTTDHKGKIECKVFCKGKLSNNKVAQVNVYSFPADPVVSGNDRLRYGEQSDLTCLVRGLYLGDKLKIEWLQGEEVLKVESEFSEEDAAPALSSVYSYTPRLGDGKTSITCRASVPVNQQTRHTTANLTVHSPPRITTVTVSPSGGVQEGQNVTVSCRAVSSPPARFVLRREGGGKERVSQDGTFWIPQVTLQDAGHYQLNVSNQLGYVTEQLTLSVMAPPRITTVTVSPSGGVQEGQNVTVSCRAVSSPPARFVLRREGGGKERVSQDGTFWIPQVTLQDAGHYQLNVSNQLGYVTEQLTLSVTAPPRITTVTVSPSGGVQEGQNVTVSCRAVSSPPARFVLRREGGGKERVSQDGTFWIPQVTLQDAGHYQLNVSNQLGYVTEQLTLSVTAPPRITTVTVSPSGGVQEGQNVTVSCRAVSSPPARFVLTREGGGKERVSQDGTFWIPQVTLQDAGHYQLNVSNQLGYVTEQLTLSVMAPPRITTVTVSPSGGVQEGQNVTVSCRAVSSPPARFVLRREGGGKERVSQDGTFWIPQVTLQDAGHYQLNVSNQLGYVTEQLTLSVMAPPRITTVTVSPSGGVQEGQNVTVSCRAVSSPPARFVLRREGGGKERVSQDGTFWIPQVTLQDAGHYQLNVSNQLGYVTEQLTLSVTAPPRITTVTVSPSGGVQEGQNVTVSCRAVSSPPARFVLRREGGGKERVSQDGTFWIPQVTLQDAGHYQLNVSNQLGYVTEQLTLSVTEQSEASTLLIKVLVPAIGGVAMVTAGAMVTMRHLRKMKAYELTMDALPML